MKKNTITVQGLLEAQAQQGFLATLESVEGHKDQVKITPSIPGHGCHCSIALKMPKDSIESLTPTEATHYCCGKILQVVEVKFKKGASISPDLLMEHLISNASHAAAPHKSSELSTKIPLSLPVRNPTGISCESRYESCIGRAIDDFDRCMCQNMLRMCNGHYGTLQQC